ncbi:MAG: protein kinase [Gemmatimonadaceae bacterium]|nr:protein kinase [Gemmatimonadaceae bacterium]
MSLSAGTRLGPYEVVALLGAGGMGEVYKARDTRLDRPVAIKVLSPLLAADPQFRDRFDREARVISQLDHPHICALYDVGDYQGASFFVMQYLEGETLAQRISRGALPLDRALDLGMQIASALDAAHRAGVVHRDLKPGNVMLATAGTSRPGASLPAAPETAQAKLLDFGLAKLVEPPAGGMEAETVAYPHTALGMVVGTTRYMSPEQARGLTVDARSDLFSYGVVLYEMLAGRAPFEASTATDVIVAILEHEPTPLTRHRGDAPLEIHRIVSKCLEKDVTRRYASSRDLLDDLERLKAEGSGTRSVAKAAPSIAVLPFVNMSNDSENEYFCDGIAEDLIGALTKIDQLRVAARTSAFSFKGKQTDLKEIGRTLNVTTVLEGSVRKAGTRLRVSAQLVNIAEGYQLWSERYDRQLDDVFEIQDEISASIVKALKVKLLGEEPAVLVKRQTTNIEAYQLYLKGRHHWHKWNAAEFAKSQECMERAIGLDPEYAIAYFGLADVYLASGAIGLRPYPELLPHASAALTRALELDPDLAEAWALMTVVHLYRWEWSAAEQAATRAIALNPRLGPAHMVRSLVYFYSGQVELTLSDANRGVALDPLAPLWHMALVDAHIAQRNYTAAARSTEVLLDLDPTFWWGHHFRGTLAVIAGRIDDAVQHFAEAVRCSGGAPQAVGLLAGALGRSGDCAAAERELATLLERRRTQHVPAISIALAYAGLGQPDRAFEWLERTFEERDIWLIAEVLYMHNLDPVRHDPRMADLRRRIAERGVRAEVEG